MTWRPMSTAPKDGTPILACVADYATGPFGIMRPDARHPQTVAFVTYHPNAPGRGAWRDRNGQKQNFLTHWRPLPAAPGRHGP